MKMMNRKTILLVTIIAVFSVVGVVWAVQSVRRTISSSGTIKAINVQVYSDEACTNPIGSINWGNREPGDTVTRTLYVKNTGNAPMIISMTVGNWSPSVASTYITITWNREGTSLSAGSSTSATISLSVSSSITGINSFSSDITIEGTG